jgi:hypothetical protein
MRRLHVTVCFLLVLVAMPTSAVARAHLTSTITLSALTPATVRADVAVRFEMDTSLATPGRIYADARDGAGPCAATYAEDLTSGARGLLTESPLTTGTFGVQREASYAASGVYSICAWAAASPTDPASVSAGPLAITVVVAPQRVRTTTTARFPARAGRTLEIRASIVAASTKVAGGTCLLQQLRRVWVELASGRTTAGRCVVSFRFPSSGRKRLRIAYLPDVGSFTGSVSRPAWVSVNRA